MAESDEFSRRLRRVGRRVVGGSVAALGYDLVRRHYYSPIPDLDSVPPSTWTGAGALTAVDLDVEGALRRLETDLAPALREYRPPRRSDGNPRTFFLDNSFYEAVDAEILYAFVRHGVPRRVLELGSGMSTLVIADALAANGGSAVHTVCDPFVRPDLLATLTSVADVRPLGATEVPLELVESLQAGDILFVDTTHTVKVGGDVNRVVLDMLPRLAPGVIVHIHDIFLPWEYPREFLVERRFFWAEQYLLQAFLAFNSAFEVICPVHALWREHPDALGRLIPSAPAAVRPAAFWMRRTQSPRATDA